MNHEPRTKNFNTKIVRILILNWRDIKNPAGGGAEILTHELAKGWTNAGYEVLVFSSMFSGAKKKETIDSVQFIRRGDWWNVHFLAFFYYLKNKKNIDIIIDEVHWFPFFSAIYARKKTIALICETASKLFFRLFPYPVALIFRAIEKIYLRIYRNVPTMTISESTKKDLIKEGINPSQITVLKMGINIPKSLKKYPKEKNPTFIYLARLNKQKGIYDAIEAFSLIKKDLSSKVLDPGSSKEPRTKTKEPRTKNQEPVLWIVGSGDDEIIGSVKSKIQKYNLSSSVKFFGFVNQERKYELLAKAHILLIPSVHEGWGLTVHEAASQKTPSIVYNVPGLRDTVQDNVTGIILDKNTPQSLYSEAVKLINDKSKYKNLQENGLKAVKTATWENSVKESIRLIKKVILQH